MLTINSIVLPDLPSGEVKAFIPYLSKHPNTPIPELLQPYNALESELRKIYAQQPHHDAVQDGAVNLVPIFAGHEKELKIRARKLDAETDDEKAKYIMPLKDHERKLDGSAAVVSSLKDFQLNFNLFSESSLLDLDWSNVVAAGSAVTTALLPVPDKWAESKRSQREYYHERLAPASDVDLFIYGLDEKQAIEKIKEVERCVKDSILHETVTIRTKNAITIASQHPTRHVQVVLRLYDSISQIITGFDVDCACVAYTGDQVYAAPRALAAFVTQCNTIDLTRRSPSYENRLSKYSHRGFEVHWGLLDRSRIDPTIFERSFGRTQGLARLLILEKLPKSADRDAYMDQRRAERGRPAVPFRYRQQHKLRGNIKDQAEDEVAEWVEQEEVSSYHTMTVPYGPKYTAAKINRLLYSQDLLLNAEWNQKKDREVHLHRHPCFFGTVEEVIQDCCGHCPVPVTDEELLVAEKEDKIYMSGELKFIAEDPGRQEIGSFNPITDDEWTTMAYVGDTARLCQAIVDGDLEHVQDWCEQEGVDVNRRDYTGRTPLHLAAMVSTPEIVQCLIDHGARMVARLVDGRTALHIAAARGSIKMVAALMNKSLENAEEEEAREAAKSAGRKAERAAAVDLDSDTSEVVSDSDDDSDDMTSGFVRVDKDNEPSEDVITQDSTEDPDIYDIDVIAWDYGISPLHMAILNGHLDMISFLVSEYAADILLPVKIDKNVHGRETNGAILTIVLAMFLPAERAKEVVQLLLQLGATSAQADLKHFSVFHYVVAQNNSHVLEVLLTHDRPAALSVLNTLGTAPGWGSQIESPLSVAVTKEHSKMVSKLLEIGAKSRIVFDDWIKAYMHQNAWIRNSAADICMTQYESNVTQPIMAAAVREMPQTILELLEHGADSSTLNQTAHQVLRNPQSATYMTGHSLLDIVQEKLKSWRDFMKPAKGSNSVETLQDETFYTTGLSHGTYRHWSAVHDLRKRQSHLTNQKEVSEANLLEGCPEGAAKKLEAVAQLIKQFERVEEALVNAGAKPFAVMHPELPSYTHRPWGGVALPGLTFKPYETSVTFLVPDLNVMKKDAYIKLFEAVWANDIETVKSMTLGMWSWLDEAPTNPPLKIAIKDHNGFSPFSIAVLCRHWTLARAIVEICQAQYHKDDGVHSRQRWTLNHSDSSDESDSEDDRLPIYAELVSDKYTVDNLGEVSTVVKSEVLPLAMIDWACFPQYILLPQEARIEGRMSVLEHAVVTNDLEMFKFMVKIGGEQQALSAENEDDQKSYTISGGIYSKAISLGQTAILSEMIKSTGVGIPLNDLVKKAGVEVKTKPKYYQGLSIGGKKRADWAKPPGVIIFAHEEKTPPLLLAAKNGSVESVEWFMSDAPMRRYKQFAEDNKNDKRIQSLNATEKGFEYTIGAWLTAKTDLALHCAILHNPAKAADMPNYMALIRHLTSVLPEALNYRSFDGWTPLHLAVLVMQEEVVSHLIALGADTRSRDKQSRNVVHHMLTQSSKNAEKGGEKLEKIIGLFPKQAVKEMLVERCNDAPGALTPLAYWMTRGERTRFGSVIKVLSEYSDGADLEMINGEGDLPLHVAIKRGESALTESLLKINPSLLHRENATGRTALEMSREMWIASCVAHPSNLNSYSDRNHVDIISKPSRDFLVGKNVILDSARRTFDICMEVDGQLIGEGEPGQLKRKRRLVSLNEANEVAKRVADMEKRRSLRRMYEDDYAKRNLGDEVTEWVPFFGGNANGSY